MTNREKLMEELAALDNDAFVFVVLSRNASVPEDIQAFVCLDCKAEYGGHCPDPDGPCALSMEDWLDRPCIPGRRLITEEALS